MPNQRGGICQKGQSISGSAAAISRSVIRNTLEMDMEMEMNIDMENTIASASANSIAFAGSNSANQISLEL